jgi:flagellar P-ring protein precursor FlgI
MFLGVLALLSVSDLIGVGNPAVAADVRIKDIADFEGIRENQLVGYGLVVGLNGTGDTLNNSPFTERSLKGMLERFGVNVRDGKLRVDNVAAVIVTANLKPFARPGNRLDVDVAALGDSESLFGGQLLVTPLIGADGEVYAVAQGALTIGGFSAGGEGQAVTKNVPTVGRIANGGIIERETGFELASLTQLRLTLRNPDLTTAGRVAQVINRAFGVRMSHPLDPTTIQLQIPANMRPNVVAMLSKVEQLRVKTDQIARVVIDEKAGIIVMGQEVRIDPVAIAQGNLTVRVTETPQVSQPNAFASQGETQVVDRTDIDVDEGGDRKLAVLEPGINLKDLVDGLNALGIGPRDMISILQAIKAAGALQAEIVVM